MNEDIVLSSCSVRSGSVVDARKKEVPGETSVELDDLLVNPPMNG